MNRELPKDVQDKLNNNKIEDITIEVLYKNWRGEIGVRKILPLDIYFGSSEFHKEQQWLMKVWDLDKEDYRTYALKDIQKWRY